MMRCSSASNARHRAPRQSFSIRKSCLTKSTPWQAQTVGDVGMIREGNYRIVVQRRNAIQPLQLALVLAPDPTLRYNVQLFPIG